MLSLVLNQGDYMTIGDDVVVQLNRITSDRCKLFVHAPREVPIVRGEVLERDGKERPSCVIDAPLYHSPDISWNRGKAQALAAMRRLLYKMDSRDDDVKTLRRQLNYIFPPELEEVEAQIK